MAKPLGCCVFFLSTCLGVEPGKIHCLLEKLHSSLLDLAWESIDPSAWRYLSSLKTSPVQLTEGYIGIRAGLLVK